MRRPTLLVAGRAFKPWFAPARLGPDLSQAFDQKDGLLTPRGPGFLSLEGRVAVVLPRPWLAADTSAASPLHTLQTLARYRRQGRKKAVMERELALVGEGTRRGGTLLEALENALLLLSDQRAHGPLLLSEERKGARERGRIHWSSTLAKTRPVPEPHGVVYPWPIRTRHRIDPETPLTRLHAQACAEAAEWLGVGPGPLRPLSRGEALKVLDSTRHRLFAHRLRRVHALLDRHFAPNRGFASERSPTRVNGLFSPRFEYVWEAMLQVGLAPLSQVGLPLGNYWTGSKTALQGARLRPDLVLDAPDDGDGYRIVLDAKHYLPDRLPVTESLTKQFVYRYLLTSAGSDSGHPAPQVGSAFLVPEIRPAHAPIRVLAVHDLQGEADWSDGPFGRVVVLGVDLVRLQKAYVVGQRDEALRAAVVDLVKQGMAVGRESVGRHAG